VKLVIKGPPRTKKTSQRILRAPGGRPFVMPSKASRAWEKSAIEQLVTQKPWADWPAVAGPVSVRALFYRDADRGDLTNFEQGVGDALQAAGIIINDRQIESWDGSRKLIDRTNPRVEIELLPMARL
jgi:Holliday junction resolvase RusA-like endonuclease